MNRYTPPHSETERTVVVERLVAETRERSAKSTPIGGKSPQTLKAPNTLRTPTQQGARLPRSVSYDPRSLSKLRAGNFNRSSNGLLRSTSIGVLGDLGGNVSLYRHSVEVYKQSIYDENDIYLTRIKDSERGIRGDRNQDVRRTDTSYDFRTTPNAAGIGSQDLGVGSRDTRGVKSPNTPGVGNFHTMSHALTETTVDFGTGCTPTHSPDSPNKLLGSAVLGGTKSVNSRIRSKLSSVLGSRVVSDIPGRRGERASKESDVVLQSLTLSLEQSNNLRLFGY